MFEICDFLETKNGKVTKTEHIVDDNKAYYLGVIFEDKEGYAGKTKQISKDFTKEVFEELRRNEKNYDCRFFKEDDKQTKLQITESKDCNIIFLANNEDNSKFYNFRECVKRDKLEVLAVLGNYDSSFIFSPIAIISDKPVV